MKKIIILILLQAAWMAGFSQSLPSQTNGGIYFQRTNLVVHWKAPKHPWPKTLSILSMVPTKYSEIVISNLMVMGSFTEKDRTDYGTNGMSFSNSGRTLGLSCSIGEIHYDLRDYGYSWSTNLAQDVPATNQLFKLTANFLPKLGIKLSDIRKGENGRPEIAHYNDQGGSYMQNGVWVTNITARGVRFRRTIDGANFIYPGGSGEIYFGEHGRITKMDLYWPSYERVNQYSAATPKQIIQWIREGRAGQYHMLTLDGGETIIDWSTVKSLTITNAVAYYDVDFFDFIRLRRPIFPSYARPYAELSGTVDTGTTNIFVVIRCPIIDETKP